MAPPPFPTLMLVSTTVLAVTWAIFWSSLPSELHTLRNTLRSPSIKGFSTTSAGLTIVANVAIAAGPALLGAPRSSVINLIYYIKYIYYSQRSQYCAKFAVSSKGRFSIERCLYLEILVSFLCVQLRNEKHEIADSVAILADLLLNLAGFSHC